MTIKQVMLVAIMLTTVGCEGFMSRKPAAALSSPYATRQVWAIAPLRNDSGSLQADGLVMADHLHRQLENASNLDVLPVNRTLAAMQALNMPQVTSPSQAVQLMRVLGADGLVVGSITAYDPYDPPKLGLTLELYTNERIDRGDAANLRRLTTAATDPSPGLASNAALSQPVTIVGAVLVASDPQTRELLEYYGAHRGSEGEQGTWRMYRISMDLYSEFAAYVMGRNLLEAEGRRVNPPVEKQKSTSGPD